MCNTMHLVSARDCLDWRALFYPLHAAEFRAHFRRGTEGADRDALLRQAKRLLEEQPRTRSELGKLLAERWPDADPSALAYTAMKTIGYGLVDLPPAPGASRFPASPYPAAPPPGRPARPGAAGPARARLTARASPPLVSSSPPRGMGRQHPKTRTRRWGRRYTLG
jgi:hypothetical protein